MERSQIIRNYGTLVGRLWESDTLVDELKAHPHKVLNEAGFEIPADSQVKLLFRDLNVEGSPNTQADLLTEGETTGVYTFIVPTKPNDLDEVPLQDEVLELMAGGSGGSTESCCCCCPCCGSSDQQV